MLEGHPLTALSKDISLIWHGANDLKNLEFFLKSDIYWAEGDLRASENGVLVLRHDPWDSHPRRTGEGVLDASEWLDILLKSGRGIQIDLKEGGDTAERLIRLLKDR